MRCFFFSKFMKQTRLNTLAGHFWPTNHMFDTPGAMVGPWEPDTDRYRCLLVKRIQVRLY